jgi:hypothetical protein
VTVTEDRKAHYQKVLIGHDYGGEVDIISGLKPGATLVLNIPDGLREGDSLRVRASQTQQPTNNRP